MNKVHLTKKKIRKLQEIVSRFDKAKIMVIGDLILDEFIWGDVSRISPEAPVPVVWAKSETFKLGGAGNVANNIVALKGKSSLVGIVGKDKWGKTLVRNLKHKNINTDGIVVDDSRSTTLKTRVVARQRNQQVVRIDRENTNPINSHILKQLAKKIKQGIKKVDAIILEDYGKGIIVPDLLKEIIKYAKSEDKKVIVDPKQNHFDYYKGITLITPNQKELEDAIGIRIKDRDSLISSGKQMLSKLKCDGLLVTLGESGMCLFEKKGFVTDIESVAQEVFDVSGAGDTVVSTFTQSLVSGASLREAALISNFAASIVVGKFGTEIVTVEELIERITNHF